MTLTTDTQIPVTAGQVCERLAGVREELSVLARASFGSFTEADAGVVVAGVEQVTRAVEALQTQCAGGIDSGQAWSRGGYQSFAAWWSLHTHRRRSTSHATRMLARDLRERLPLTAQALTEGQLGLEHARVLARFTKSEGQRAQLEDEAMGEGFLVAAAGRMNAEDFTGVVKTWALRTDPGAGDRNWREQGATRELFVSQVLDGTDIRGWLGTEEGAVINTALDAVIGTPAAGDERTPAQRRADALVHLCRTFLDAGTLQPGARIRPHLAITIDYTTLERLLGATGPTCTPRDAFGQPTLSDANASGGGVVIPAGLDYDLLRGTAPATFADGTPIPHGQLTKLVCDGEFHRVIFGPEGEILDSGRTQRLFTPAQTRAVIARDRHCQYPSCTAPPGQGEIHHSIWWYHQGHTSTENAILLCWYHHTLVHQHHLSITAHPAHSPDQPRWWTFTDPHGQEITTIPPPTATHTPPPPTPPQRQ
ncbi:HNH endonuclease signature motif containing protein [Ruania zhangjianzhongii]|uniref:HNH endonuclease signature motif containing protein n=1 Tax=Ruania zhangjianzhongii TaxID=2603206 RepID=UPI0011C92875|nr:HNH endonuclease signature motif containing protein [Ruania zhangjianzhongii]